MRSKVLAEPPNFTEYDQKSPVGPVSSSIKGESLTNSAEKLRREFHLLHLGLHFAQKGRPTSHDYILDHVFPTNFTITRRNMIQKTSRKNIQETKDPGKTFLQQQKILISQYINSPASTLENVGR